MKILHVLNEIRPSGAETMLRIAAEPWKERGLDLEVLSVGNDVGPYAPTLARAGYRIHHIPLYPVGHFVSAYVRLQRTGRYDVVHVHPERANFLLAAVPRVISRAGVIRTIHTVFAFEGRLRLERRLQRALLRSTGVVHVAIGASVESSERRRFGNRTVRVVNTFDEARFRPATAMERRRARSQLDLRDEDFVVVVLGNCAQVKNHAALIEALAMPAAPAATLLHVGIEREAETGERELVDRHGLSGQVEFLGFVDDVPAILQAADCFAMPSHHEGFPVAALEALGCGIPSVLADVPGLRDLRPHLPFAWWVAPHPEPIAGALAEVARMDGGSRQHWVDRAAAMVRDQFGVEAYVDAYRQLYREVARRGG
ncbi:glycosyltransferase [Nitriliruptor alkaliphilus]|uniref:glycosyltransferase n=1 Tax=Nitriliruptor alkaliphilus TaxID=427918 RepID=UPI0006980D4D|nr:glycosyltransferase [Nitriliruptor alkaliphilus]